MCTRSIQSLLIEAKVIRRRKQLETDLNWDIHVGNVFAVAILVPVVEVFDHFVQHNGTVERQQVSLDLVSLQDRGCRVQSRAVE